MRLALAFVSSLSIANVNNNVVNAQSDSNFCGLSWDDATNTCSKCCPSGSDDECIDELGAGYKCQTYTGCRDRIDRGEIADPCSNGDNDNSDNNLFDDSDDLPVFSDSYCATSWIQAMQTCSTPCPRSDECTESGHVCFAATGCNRPLEKLTSDMLVTLLGADSAMDDADGDIFLETMYAALRDEVEGEEISLGDVDLGEQIVSVRRRGLMGNKNNLRFDGEVHRRRLPTGSSALDVSMVITGEYRPPPYKDLNEIVEKWINRRGDDLVATLRERGERAGRVFFERVEGMEAQAMSTATARPTRSPVWNPTVRPTSSPSAYPSESPSWGEFSCVNDLLSMPSRHTCITYSIHSMSN